MRIPRTRASEHLHHRGVQQMFRTMSRFILGLIVLIEYWLSVLVHSLFFIWLLAVMSLPHAFGDLHVGEDSCEG